MNPATWLHRSGLLFPEKSALYRGQTVVATYSEWSALVFAAARRLKRDHGVGHGDRIVIWSKNRTEYLVALYAIWHLGAVVVPVNAKLHAREFQWICQDSGARLAFVDEGAEAALDALPSLKALPRLALSSLADLSPSEAARDEVPPFETASDQMIWLFYTSGTTGKPKGVMITSGNIEAMIMAYLSDVDEVLHDDHALYAAPLSHGAGIYNFQHVIKGAGHVIPESGGFDAREVLLLAAHHQNVHMFLAPTMVKRLVECVCLSSEANQATACDGIRTIVYGGGPMYLADIEEAVRVMGNRFCQIYGQGESPMAITVLPRSLVSDRTHPGWKDRLQSVGYAQSCCEVRIVDDEGKPVPPGKIGEITVRGPSVMAGYWQNPQATQTAIREGWLWTGDMGTMDEDGFVTLKDRSKDVIISGGTNIYPREVEETLLQHAGVAEVSVVGAPDEEWGERVEAFVVLNPGMAADAQKLDAHCLDHIARFKRPKAYHFVDQLPKNNFGKVLKTELRQRIKR